LTPDSCPAYVSVKAREPIQILVGGASCQRTEKQMTLFT
jgi:hypothetical protein